MYKAKLNRLETDSGNAACSIIGEMTESLSYYLCNKGISVNTSHKIANEVIDSICQQYGGSHFYLPKFAKRKTIKRDAEIYEEYTKGAFVNELAVKYGVSLQAIYLALRRYRKNTKKEPDKSDA